MHFSQRGRAAGAAVLAAALPFAYAQTSTSCNPLDKTCPADPALDASTFVTDFTKGSSAAASWSMAEGTTLNYGSQGAEFTISQAGQAPTISSDFYIFFGHVDVMIKAAPGTGIVSSIVLESDDLDEIDWEFLGGNTAQCETNFFGKGNTTLYNRAIYYNVAEPQSEFHTYSVDWTSERLEYIIDGTVVRTLTYDNSLTVGGSQYPQTPMRIKLGNWAGGGPGSPPGTVEWAGGDTDFSQGPFTMYVTSVNVTNYNPGSSYTYGDKSGSFSSIQVAGGSGNSSAVTTTIPTTVSSGSSTFVSSITSTSTAESATAPTSSLSVAPLRPTGAVVSSVVTGSAYSTNSASVAAQNSGETTVVTKTSTLDDSTTSGASTPSSTLFTTTTTSTTGAKTSSTSPGLSSPTGNAAAPGRAVAAGSLLGGLAAGLLLL